jgi:hypothetical protein
LAERKGEARKMKVAATPKFFFSPSLAVKFGGTKTFWKTTQALKSDANYLGSHEALFSPLLNKNNQNFFISCEYLI